MNGSQGLNVERIKGRWNVIDEPICVKLARMVLSDFCDTLNIVALG